MLKFTIHMSGGGRSWSEAHYGNFSGSPDDQRLNAIALANNRAYALGLPARVDRVVVSNVPANRRVVPFSFQVGPSVPGGGLVTGSPLAMEMGNNAPLVQWVGRLIAPGSGLAVPANYYPAGCQDGLFSIFGPDSGHLNKGTPGYAGLVQWLAFLLPSGSLGAVPSPWCYRTRNPVGAVQATGLVAPAVAGGIIGVVTQQQVVNPGPPAVALAVGDKVNLTGWRVANPRKKNLQGAYKIQAIVTAAGPPATWTYYLYRTDGFQIANWPDPGMIGPLLYTFASYNVWTAEQWVTRKRGGRYALPLGRSPLHRSV